MTQSGAQGSSGNREEVTALLAAWRQGSDEALERLLPLVYDELRRIARRHMQKERPGHTLEPTALVHQAYERLLGLEVDWRDRAHFLNMASRTMRRVLVDHARARRRTKRGGEGVRISLDEAPEGDLAAPASDLVALDEALDALAKHDERKSGLVQAHYFGGLTYRELAEVFGISEATAHRDLQFARVWLGRELSSREG